MQSGNGQITLYDLKRDPREEHDLVAKQGKVVKEMLGELEDWKKMYGERVTPTGPPRGRRPGGQRGGGPGRGRPQGGGGGLFDPPPGPGE